MAKRQGANVSRLAKTLNSGKFAVTCELNPPKGVDLTSLYEKAETLKEIAVAINVTDSASSRMTMGNIAVAHLLLDRGIDPILQITCRDRNRLALQSELLAAYGLGITNMLFMSGDPPSGGDHPEAKAVFDLNASELLAAARSLVLGKDMAGNDLNGAPKMFTGAVVNPGAEDLDVEIRRMEEKIEAGAQFFQTQAVYDPQAFEGFMVRVEGFRVPILAGVIVPKSPNMARYLNDKVPGINVPAFLIDEIETAADRRATAVSISARIIKAVREMCQGVHIMAIGWESSIPDIVKAAGIPD